MIPAKKESFTSSLVTRTKVPFLTRTKTNQKILTYPVIQNLFK